MSIDKCEKCGRFVYKGDCNCERFTIFYPEYYGDDGITRYGVDFDDVAEKFAEEFNEEENYITNDNVFESPIEVVDKNGNVKHFNVYAEPKINYYAAEIHNGVGYDS